MALRQKTQHWVFWVFWKKVSSAIMSVQRALIGMEYDQQPFKYPYVGPWCIKPNEKGKKPKKPKKPKKTQKTQKTHKKPKKTLGFLGFLKNPKNPATLCAGC